MASGKEGDETIPVLEVSVEKEGYFELLKKGKWKRYYFLLSGGCLYYKSKEKVCCSKFMLGSYKQSF